ncbi:MAG: ribonuclease J [Culicoidibacterales bacterium]
MNKLQICALGGLDENGKNMYVVEYNNALFIIDAGLKYPDNALFGIDKVVPDITYLIENKDRIAGLFITHAHEDHYGGVTQLLQKITVPIYATRLTKAIIADVIQSDGITNYKGFNEVKPGETKKVKGVDISFIQMTHSIPENCAISIATEHGAVVFSSDYVFDPSAQSFYAMNMQALNTLGENGVHTLMLSSRGIEKDGFAGNTDAFRKEVSNMFYGVKGRIILTSYATDLKRIQNIIDSTVEYNRKLFISGVRGQRLIDIALRLGYLEAPKGLIIGPNELSRQEKNLVVLVAGNSGVPFRSLIRMSKNRDKFIQFKKTDTLILGTPAIAGNEKISAIALDAVYASGCKVISMSKNVFTSSHAAKEDAKMLIKMLNPKYIFPVDGDYRHFVHVEEIACQLGMDKNQVQIRDNGEQLTFDAHGVPVKKIAKIKTDDVLIDGAVLGDVSDFVLRDRMQLSEDGIVTVSMTVKRKEGRLVGKPQLNVVGFVHREKSKQFLNDIENAIYEAAQAYFSKGNTDWNQLKGEVRELTNKMIYKRTKRKPVIMTVILDA